MDLIHFHFHFHNEINQSINRRVLNFKLHIAGRCVIFAVAGFRDFWVRHEIPNTRIKLVIKVFVQFLYRVLNSYT